MSLPDDFHFSQASLQDFSDCRRRFQLRYLDRLAWPAVESEPVLDNEARMRAGSQLHTMVHQHQIGIAPEKIEAAIRDPELLRWWNNYLSNAPADLPESRYLEHMLSVPLAGYRLLARFDMLAVSQGERLVIVDWKTSQNPPGRKWLAERLQTRVYRYVAVEGMAHLNGGKRFDPDQVSLTYWFANDPDASMTFPYSTAEHEQTGQVLHDQIQTIAALPDDQFFLTDDVSRCRFCPYRSLCNRGISAGIAAGPDMESKADPGDFELDLEQVIEIAF